MAATILVIGDADASIDRITDSLVAAGYDVARSAFAPLRRGRFVLVLADVPPWCWSTEGAEQWAGRLRARYGGAPVIVLERPTTIDELFMLVAARIGAAPTVVQDQLAAAAIG